MKIIKITFEAGERNGNATKKQSFELMVNNMVAKKLTCTEDTVCESVLKTITELAATLQTGDLFAKSEISDMEEVNDGNRETF